MHRPTARALTGSADHPRLSFVRTDRTSPAALRRALVDPERLARWFGEIGGVLACEEDLVQVCWSWQADAPADEEIEERAVERWRGLTRAPLVITRLLPAPPERVWETVASTEGLRSWWWTPWDDVSIEADMRPGGAYRIRAPRIGVELGGTCLEAAPGRHLAFTWQWADADGVSADEAVEITLAPQVAGTLLTLHHTGPWSEGDGQVENYRLGWEDTLSALERLLGS